MAELNNLMKVKEDMKKIEDGEKIEFDKAMAEFASFFKGEEEKAEPIKHDLAKTLNKSLRLRPVDNNIKETAAKIKFPSNLPNLVPPATNKDLLSAMKLPAKLLDASQTRIAGLIAKAMTPIATIISEIGEQKSKKIEDYFDPLVSSLRLLSAAFNYTNQARKDNIRMNIHDRSLGELCKWDVEVGTEELFPFDCTKKIEEMKKSKKIGSKYSYPRGSRATTFNMYGPGRSDYRYNPYYKGRKPSWSNQAPRYENRHAAGEDRAKNPFFRGRGKYDKKK